jgi:hypothetical protein
MTLTPTSQPDQIDVAEPAELLIKEARRASRHRRVGYGLAAIVVVAVLTIIVSSTVSRPEAKPSKDTSPRQFALSLPRCDAAQLRVWDDSAEGAADYGALIVRLKNVSAHACSLSGYPSVQGIDQWNGALVTAAHTRDSYMGGWESTKPFPVVALRSKTGVASFLIDFVSGNDIRACPYLNTLRVSVPHSTTVFTLNRTMLQACKYFGLHPIVPGLMGSAH